MTGRSTLLTIALSAAVLGSGAAQAQGPADWSAVEAQVERLLVEGKPGDAARTIRQAPVAMDAAAAGWLEKNATRLPPPFLLELAERSIAGSEDVALTWYVISAIRTFHDQRRCRDDVTLDRIGRAWASAPPRITSLAMRQGAAQLLSGTIKMTSKPEMSRAAAAALAWDRDNPPTASAAWVCVHSEIAEKAKAEGRGRSEQELVVSEQESALIRRGLRILIAAHTGGEGLAADEIGERVAFETMERLLEIDCVTSAFTIVFALPEGSTAALERWIENRAESLPALFLYERARRAFNSDAKESLKWSYVARLRLEYDARRCADPAIGEAVAREPSGAHGPGFAILDMEVPMFAKANPGAAAEAAEAALRWDQDQPSKFSPVWICRYGAEPIWVLLDERRQPVDVALRPESEWPAIREQVRDRLAKQAAEWRAR